MRGMKKSVLVFILLFLVACAFFREAAFFRKAFFYCDIVGFNLPRRQFLGERLIEGVFPLWSRHALCGFPIFAEGQTGFLYPPNLLLFPFLKAWKALNISMVLNFFLGSCFMFAYLKRRVSTLPAILGGITFSYSGYFLCHSIHTCQINVAIWLPLLFLFADKALEGGGFRSVVIAACVFAVMCFANYPNTYMISLVGLSFYLFYRGLFSGRLKGLISCLLVLSLILLLGVGLGAVQLLPLAEMTKYSVRSGTMPYGFLVQGSFSPAFLATLMVPNLFGNRGSDTEWLQDITPYHEMDVYMGIFPFLLLLIALIHGRERRMLPWFALWITSVILMLGKYTPFYHIFSCIPYFDRMRVPCKFNLLFCLSSSVLIASAAERLFEGRRLKLLPVAAGVILAVIFTASVYYVTYDGIFSKLGEMDPLRFSPANREMLEKLKSLIASDIERGVIFMVAGLAVILAARYRILNKNLIACGCIVFVLVDLFLFSRTRVAFIDPALFTDVPPTVALLREDGGVFRIYSDDPPPEFSYIKPGWLNDKKPYFYSLLTLPYDTQMLFDLSSIRGGSPLVTRRMGRVLSSYRRGFIDMLNGRYILSWRRLPGAGLDLIYDRGPFVYFNRRALERAYVVPAAAFVRSGEEAFAVMESDSFDPREAVVIEGAGPRDFQLAGPGHRGVKAKPEIRKYSDNEVVIEVDMPYNGFLVLSDSYYPGWHAEDNGEEAGIYRANYLVRAVYLEKGRHRVRFIYRPVTFRYGLIISIATLAVIVLLYLPGGKGKSGLLAIPPEEGETSRRAKLIIVGVLVILVVLSLVIEPGHWKDAFMTLRVR